MGDLNLDRLKPSDREGKILTDLKEAHELKGLTNQPTHVTTTSQILLYVTLVNSPNSIKVSGVAELGHRLVYALANKGIKDHVSKSISCRSAKHLNVEELKADVGDIHGLKLRWHQHVISTYNGKEGL